jgi:hypothetical protein
VCVHCSRTIQTLNRAIGDLDTIVDKTKYLEMNGNIFTINKRMKFEPHKGDEVSTVNAQVLIRDEMQSRFIQMQGRLASLKTENDEVSRHACIYVVDKRLTRGKDNVV